MSRVVGRLAPVWFLCINMLLVSAVSIYSLNVDPTTPVGFLILIQSPLAIGIAAIEWAAFALTRIILRRRERFSEWIVAGVVGLSYLALWMWNWIGVPLFSTEWPFLVGVTVIGLASTIVATYYSTRALKLIGSKNSD